jgi:NADH-quinone oxidoreductase subunit C
VTLEAAPAPKRAISLLPADTASSLTAGLKARVETALDETVFTVALEDYRTLCERLYNAGFDFPSSLTGVDMEWGLGVVLHVQQLESKRKAAVRVYVPYAEPRVPTVSDLWGGVEWHEREAYDLVGITFTGHADLRRILLEDHWTIHPLQRKYNTRGYAIPQWTAKPWPSPAPWEEGFAPFGAAAAPTAHAPATRPAVATSTSAAASTATPSSVAAETKAANEQGAPVTPAPSGADVPAASAPTAEAPKKVAKKWVPKTPAGDAAPAASSVTPAGDAVPREATPTPPAPVVSSEPAPAVSSEATQASSTEVSSAPAPTEPAAPATEEKPRSPKIKRWEPKS